MTRRAYATPEKQAEASRRYFENNKDAKLKRKIKNYKWSGKKFILEFANENELKEYEEYIKARRVQIEWTIIIEVAYSKRSEIYYNLK